jgi:hypothetical protein
MWATQFYMILRIHEGAGAGGISDHSILPDWELDIFLYDPPMFLQSPYAHG